MRENNWKLDISYIDRGMFSLEKIMSETRVVVYSQIRLLEVEAKAREEGESAGKSEFEMLRDQLDKDDIMKRLAEHLDDEHFLKMFSIFYVCIAKVGEENAVIFQCKSHESDIIIEYACTLPAADIEDYTKVIKTANLYRGVESMMLEENYRIGMHEYLIAHTVTEDLATLIEHLAVVLPPLAVEETLNKLKDFAMQGIRL